MEKFLQVLKFGTALLPWIMAAEERFGSGKGAEKKAFILAAIDAAGSALLTRYAVPGQTIAEFRELAAEAVDMAVHMAHFTGLFRADKKKLDQTHLALAIPLAEKPVSAFVPKNEPHPFV